MAGLILGDLQHQVLTTRIDGGERFRAVWRRRGAVSTLRVGTCLLGQVRRKCGYGLLALEKRDLYGWPGASPFRSVLAGVDGLSEDQVHDAVRLAATIQNRSAAPKTNVNTLEILIHSSFKVSVATTVQDTARVARGLVFILLVKELDVRMGAVSQERTKIAQKSANRQNQLF